MVSVTAPNGVNISSIKNGATTVTKTGNWTYSSGKLTFKSSYLSSLDVGEVSLTILMSNGDTATVAVTVGA